MYLQSIQLENYRRFKFAQTEFPDGVVGIIGNNGAGKSTLMEAIAWALYGNEAARTGKEEIKRLTAKPQEVSRVILDFELQGENYQVVRELRGNSMQADASVLINGKVVARGVTPVNDFIEKTLDMDYRAFITSFYAPQKELNVLSDFPPYKRKEVLARMLGIERIDIALKSVRNDRRVIDMGMEIDEAFVQSWDRLLNEEKELHKNLVALSKKAKDDQKIFEAQNGELGQFETHLNNLKNESEIYYKLKGDLSVKEALSSELASQITKIQEEIRALDNLKPELDKLEVELEPYPQLKQDYLTYETLRVKDNQRKVILSEIKGFLELIQEYKKRIGDLVLSRTDLEEAQKNLEKLLQEKIEIEEQLDKARLEFVQIQSNYKVSLDRQHKLEAQLQGIEKLGPDSVCDRCLRPFGADYPRIREHLNSEFKNIKTEVESIKEEKNVVEEKGQEFRARKANLQENIDSLQKRIEGLIKETSELDALENGLKDREAYLKSRQDNLKQLGEFKFDLSVYQKLGRDVAHLEFLRDKYISLTQEQRKLPNLRNDLSHLEQNLVSLHSEKQAIAEKLKSFSFSEEELRKIEKKVEDKRSTVHRLELSLKELYYGKEMVRVQLKNLRKEIRETKAMKKRLKQLGEEKLYLAKLDDILVSFKTSLISRIRPVLAAYAKELFIELTDGRYEDFELNEEYEIFIYDQGEKFSIDRFSGGEKDLANLCLRLAISLLISESSGVEFSFIILDEIFGSQDASRKENILKGLAKLKNRFRQIFLITHIDDIKDSVENLITVLENEDGTSQLILQ